MKYGTQPDEFYDPMNDSAPRANPNAGKAFSEYFSLDNDGNEIQETEYSDNVNGDSWVDDVVFPSGCTDPMYISDWEWMFEIFDKAMEEQGITDGYCMSMYYPGYIANGDLVTGFGGGGIAITDKAKDKGLALLFRFLDNLYSEEGNITRTMGLSAEQMAECQNENYQEYGLEDGAYTVVNEDGEDVYYYVTTLEQDEGNLRSAMTGNRLPGIKCSSKMGHTDTETFKHSREEWVAYEATGFIASLNSRRTADAISEHQKIKSRIEDEYMYINVPQFIKGEKNLDSDWETFCSDLQKRDYQAVCDGYNEALK